MPRTNCVTGAGSLMPFFEADNSMIFADTRIVARFSSNSNLAATQCGSLSALYGALMNCASRT